MSHDGARTLARSMKRNKMLRERVMDNNRGGVAGKVSEPIPTFHLHNTHYNTFIYLIFKDNYFLSVIVHSPRLVFQSHRHFWDVDTRRHVKYPRSRMNEKVEQYHRYAYSRSLFEDISILLLVHLIINCRLI